MGHAESKALRSHDDPDDGRLGPEIVTLTDARGDGRQPHREQGRGAGHGGGRGRRHAARAWCSRRRSRLPSMATLRQAGEHPALRRAFELAGGDEHPLVARSSSVLEDTAGSSMAGQFDSIIGISGFPAFADAVQTVLDSRERAGVAGTPIAVLVQPLIEPRYGGVLFGVDPVTGRTDRWTVSAVDGGPEPLVSGEVDGSRYLLDGEGQGRRVHARRRTPSSRPPLLRRLVALSEAGGDASSEAPRTWSGRSGPTATSGCSSPAR